MGHLVGEHLFYVFLQSLQYPLSVLGIEHRKAGTSNIQSLSRGKERRKLILDQIVNILDPFDVIGITAIKIRPSLIILTDKSQRGWPAQWYAL